jgi:hypothetical protein
VLVSQLSNGTLYQFNVFALNVRGESLAASATATPNATVPGPPTRVIATHGDRQVTLTWNPPLDDGGSTITDYKIVAFAVGSGTTATYYVPTLGDPTFSRATITGLTNGVTYTFDVSAGNKTGPGGATAYGTAGTSNPVTPATVPGAPAGVTAVGRHQSVVLNWTAPDTGGDPITSYRVTVSPFITGSPFSVPGSDTSYTVNGLTNGTTYSFTVQAVNTVGAGAASPPVTATPRNTVPDAPQPASAVRGNQQVTVNWTVPLYDGGYAIDSYRVEVYRDGAATAERTLTVAGLTTTSTTITGLLNGHTYTFKVYAHNAMPPPPGGFSAAATTSPVTPATVPDVPIFRNPSTPVAPDVSGVTLDAVTLSDPGKVTVRWNAYPPVLPCTGGTPAYVAECHPTGGDPVSGYDVVAYQGTSQVTGLTVTIITSGTDTPRATVEGLVHGTEYTLRVRAKNGAGDSPWLISAPIRTGPRVRFDLATYNYGPVLIGTSLQCPVGSPPPSNPAGRPCGAASTPANPLTITLTNWGSGDLVVNSLVFPTTHWSVFADVCAGNAVPAKATCQTNLSFAPVARGPLSGTFQVASNSIDPSPLISLSGTGVGPSVAYAPASHAFGTQAVGTQSEVRTVTVSNNSSGDSARDLHINSLSIDGFGAPNFLVDQVADLCTGATVAPGQSCTVGIRFAPIRPGATDATLRVEHDAFIDPVRVTLSGTGT